MTARAVASFHERAGRWRQRFIAQEYRAPSLDWLNFLVADVRGALGPYVAVFLVAQQNWTPTAVGLVSMIGGCLGLIAQTPIGALLDHTPRKRGVLLLGLPVVSAGALTVAWFPSFWPVLVANGAMQVASGIFEPAIAALTVGLCVRSSLTARMARNAAWARAGNVVVAATSAFVAYAIGTRAVFLQVPVMALLTAVVAMTIPHGKLDLRRARGLPGEEDQNGDQAGWSVLLRSRPLRMFLACSLLYELAAAPLLTLVGQKLGLDNHQASLIQTSELIIASQAGMLFGSLIVGRCADRLGIVLLLLLGLALLPIQAVLTSMTSQTILLVAIQVFGGVGTGIFMALTPLWLADATSGTGRYNLSQGAAATMRSIGVSLSGFGSGFLADRCGFATAFLVCGLIGAGAATLLGFGLMWRTDGSASRAWSSNRHSGRHHPV